MSAQHNFFFLYQAVDDELQRIVSPRFSSLDLGQRVTCNLSVCIGAGSYGTVYEGILLPSSRVAVKSICRGDQTVFTVRILFLPSNPCLLTINQEILREVYVWSKLQHENILQLFGITTMFDRTISIVSPMMSRGNAFKYVQDPSNDPRPLVGYLSTLHLWII